MKIRDSDLILFDDRQLHTLREWLIEMAEDAEERVSDSERPRFLRAMATFLRACAREVNLEIYRRKIVYLELDDLIYADDGSVD
jgi:predicted phosphatase